MKSGSTSLRVLFSQGQDIHRKATQKGRAVRKQLLKAKREKIQEEMHKKADHGGLLSLSKPLLPQRTVNLHALSLLWGGLPESSLHQRPLVTSPPGKLREEPLTPAPCGSGIWEWTVSPRLARPGAEAAACSGPAALQGASWA